MCIDNRNGELFPRLVRTLMPLLFLIGTFYVSIAAVYAQSSVTGSAFRFNDLYTTPFGPAYADIVTKDENFLACKPPVGQTFSYALLLFGSSGRYASAGEWLGIHQSAAALHTVK